VGQLRFGCSPSWQLGQCDWVLPCCPSALAEKEKKKKSTDIDCNEKKKLMRAYVRMNKFPEVYT